MIELKPCPCCKGDAEGIASSSQEGVFHIHCSSCFLKTRGCATVEAAADLWNMRHVSAADSMSVEKRAVRLADVYNRASAAVAATLPPASSAEEIAARGFVAHQIALLLVQQALREESEQCR